MRQEQGQTGWVGSNAAIPRLAGADSGRDWQMVTAQRISALEQSSAAVLNALNLQSAFLEEVKSLLRDQVLEGIRRLNALEDREKSGQAVANVSDAVPSDPTQRILRSILGRPMDHASLGRRL